ncbi:MAG: T9SS type A sorting domain-containing protein [Saprospiraceae bacterium]|nr:T9SS type A sorting domain-containing protein [Saprospiraceae bacterium]
MKRVFLLFFLMLGVFFTSQAASSFDGCDAPGTLTSDTYNAGGGDCGVGCVVERNTARIMFGNTGGCAFGFYYYHAPTILTQDPECAGLSIRFSWNFGDSTPSTTPSSSLFANHSFPGNGTYVVCVTTIVYDAMGVPCDTLQPPVCVTVEVKDCTPPCDPLDCSKIQVKNIGTNQVSFTLPVEECEECPNPDYTISYRRSEVEENWSSGGYQLDANGDVTLYFLQPCTHYEILVELRCNGSDEVIKSCTFNIMTGGCLTGCNPGFDCNQITVTANHSVAQFSFPPINCPNCPNPRYEVAYRAVVTPPATPNAWIPVSFGMGSLSGLFNGNITGLQPCTTYELRVELRCPNPLVPDPWNEPVVATCIVQFTTLCPFVAPEGDGFVVAAPLQLSVYPNPANEEVTFLVISDQDAEGVIQIFNNLGALVKQLNAQTNNPTAVSLDGLESGVYHYSFIAESGANLRTSGKLVIVK